jgi:two-component system C4-dicarboxylate transport response regulator DctD
MDDNSAAIDLTKAFTVAFQGNESYGGILKKEAAMGCQTTSNASEVSALPTRQILLVDDDSALLDVLPRTIELRIAQVTVTACDSAEAALAHVQSNRYDLVITDLNMPRINGLTLVRQIKALLPEMPILIITGHGDEAAEHQAMQAGVDGFILKPFDRLDLAAAIERLLDNAGH